jgi:hypothetical protein
MAVYFDQNGNLVDTEDNINFFNTGTEQVFPKQGLEPLYPNFGAPMVNDTSLSPDLPYDTLRFVDNNSLSLQPNYLMPNTNKVPQLPANRLEGLPSLNLQSLPANMGVANEEDVEQVDSLTGQKKSGGILDLIMSIAVPGYGFLKNIGKGGLEGIRGLNQRLRQSDFGQAKNLSDYFDMRSYGGLRERENKSAQTMAQARGIQKQMAQRPSATPSARDLAMGRGEGDGPQKDAAATRSRDLGSMRGAVGR